MLQKLHCWRGESWLSQTPILSLVKVCICLKFFGGTLQSSGTESYQSSGTERGRSPFGGFFLSGIKGGLKSQAKSTAEPWEEGRTWARCQRALTGEGEARWEAEGQGAN